MGVCVSLSHSARQCLHPVVPWRRSSPWIRVRPMVHGCIHGRRMATWQRGPRSRTAAERRCFAWRPAGKRHSDRRGRCRRAAGRGRRRAKPRFRPCSVSRAAVDPSARGNAARWRGTAQARVDALGSRTGSLARCRLHPSHHPCWPTCSIPGPLRAAGGDSADRARRRRGAYRSRSMAKGLHGVASSDSLVPRGDRSHQKSR